MTRRRPYFSALRQQQVPAKPAILRCTACHAKIRKYDRYKILQVVHKSCGDPRMVGQQSFGVPA